jgi:hypothetical protein
MGPVGPLTSSPTSSLRVPPIRQRHGRGGSRQPQTRRPIHRRFKPARWFRLSSALAGLQNLQLSPGSVRRLPRQGRGDGAYASHILRPAPGVCTVNSSVTASASPVREEESPVRDEESKNRRETTPDSSGLVARTGKPRSHPRNPVIQRIKSLQSTGRPPQRSPPPLKSPDKNQKTHPGSA